jgi:hypothetical protein
MNEQVLVAAAPQKQYPLVEAGRYESIYENAYRDLESGGISLKASGFEAKIFVLDDLGGLDTSKVGLLKRFAGRTEPIYAGTAFQAIDRKIKATGWESATLGHLIAYEAQNFDKHEYPLFAVGLFYSHGWSHGEISQIPQTRIIPFIKKTETGGRRLDEYIFSSPLGGTPVDDTILKGYFLAVR